MNLVARLRGLFTNAAPLRADTVDLTDPWALAERFSVYEQLRREGSVVHLARSGRWLVLGHAEVREALSRPELFSNAPYTFVDDVLLGADPPDHEPVRKLASGLFSGAAINRLCALAEARARERARQEMDVVADFAGVISQAVAMEIIGIGSAEAEAIAQDRLDASRGQTGDPPFARLDAIIGRAALIEELQRKGALDPARAHSLVRLMWLASTVTTERVIVHAVLQLLRDLDARTAVSHDRALLGPFIEEVMRLQPPEHLLPRRTTASVRLGKVIIPADAHVELCVAAANRDPARFDLPNTFRLDRPGKLHLSLGGGIHHCLGAPLVRKVVPAAIGTLLTETPDFAAAEPLDALQWFASPTAWAPQRLMTVPGRTVSA